jgi:DNA-3-methyladenine glycosylase
MFGPPGTAYVYRIYGLHWCLNVVTEAEGFPSAVLIRAVWPTRGLVHMRQRRWPASPRSSNRQLASGPGKLAAAFGITNTLDRHDLCSPPLFILPDTRVGADQIVSGPRIGVTRALDWPLRFHIVDCPWISQR